MVQQTIPYIILAFVLVVGLLMCIAGCAIDKCWYPFFSIIPGAIAIFLGYGFYVKSMDENNLTWITLDGILFMIVISIVSLLALPLVLFHVDTIRTLSLCLNLGGLLVLIIGTGVFLGLAIRDDFGSPIFCGK
ncbi:hypothetical protein GPJ56_006875 [Histomonas meleagridis]|uniref:uncharacterized protein n=1 Tax=Histomonas meleagridis TaxID=135588 RepID=UPI0035596E17|nr:hypothetical protein GPJ56_006875 [Histomonas meleagridis]KAH0802365.1 hypothetical protein GO595_004978 [Histomonas meleagridis]